MFKNTLGSSPSKWYANIYPSLNKWGKIAVMEPDFSPPKASTQNVVSHLVWGQWNSWKNPFSCCLFKHAKHPTSWTHQVTNLRALQLQAWVCFLFNNNFICLSLVIFALVLSDQEVNAIQQTVWGRSHVSFCGCTVYFKQLDIRHDGQFASFFTKHSLLIFEECCRFKKHFL